MRLETILAAVVAALVAPSSARGGVVSAAAAGRLEPRIGGLARGQRRRSGRHGLGRDERRRDERARGRRRQGPHAPSVTQPCGDGTDRRHERPRRGHGRVDGATADRWRACRSDRAPGGVPHAHGSMVAGAAGVARRHLRRRPAAPRGGPGRHRRTDVERRDRGGTRRRRRLAIGRASLRAAAARRRDRRRRAVRAHAHLRRPRPWSSRRDRGLRQRCEPRRAAHRLRAAATVPRAADDRRRTGDAPAVRPDRARPGGRRLDRRVVQHRRGPQRDGVGPDAPRRAALRPRAARRPGVARARAGGDVGRRRGGHVDAVPAGAPAGQRRDIAHRARRRQRHRPPPPSTAGARSRRRRVARCVVERLLPSGSRPTAGASGRRRPTAERSTSLRSRGPRGTPWRLRPRASLWPLRRRATHALRVSVWLPDA